MSRARGILLCSALGLFLPAVVLHAATDLPLSDQDFARRSPVIVRAVVQGSAVRVESVVRMSARVLTDIDAVVDA